MQKTHSCILLIDYDEIENEPRKGQGCCCSTCDSYPFCVVLSKKIVHLVELVVIAIIDTL